MKTDEKARKIILAGFMKMNNHIMKTCDNCELSTNNFIDRLRKNGFKIVRVAKRKR